MEIKAAINHIIRYATHVATDEATYFATRFATHHATVHAIDEATHGAAFDMLESIRIFKLSRGGNNGN